MAQIKDKAKQIQKLKSMGQYGSPIPSSGKKEAFVNLQRQKFFDGRKDVPEERVLRRTRQEGILDQFKQSLVDKGRVVKGLTTTSGEPVYLTDVPGGRSVADVSKELAYKYGPTPREILGDVAYAGSSMLKGFTDKLMSGELGIIGIVKGLYDKFTKTAADAKNYLGAKINQLSDIDLERLKNQKNYKLTSQSPELKEIYQLEADEASARNTRDILGARINEAIKYGPSVMTPGQVTIEEQVSTPVTQKVYPSFTSLPGSGYQAGANMGIAAIQPGYEIVTDYESPEQKMQRLIEENQINKNNMFNSGIVKNKLSELEKVFNISPQ